MSDKNKALSNQSFPDVKATRKKAVKKLNMALKIAYITIKVISVIEKIIGWLG